LAITTRVHFHGSAIKNRTPSSGLKHFLKFTDQVFSLENKRFSHLFTPPIPFIFWPILCVSITRELWWTGRPALRPSSNPAGGGAGRIALSKVKSPAPTFRFCSPCLTLKVHRACAHALRESALQNPFHYGRTTPIFDLPFPLGLDRSIDRSNLTQTLAAQGFSRANAISG
jgi:hypothetical protein